MTDLDSTLIRRGVHAATFSDMAEFVHTIESRPLDKLLSELPGIARLSDTKFSLARQVLRRRVKELDRATRDQLRLVAFEVAQDSGDEVGDRIRGIFGFA
jgi:hypothetical protein